jgi:hypothetical protein
MGSGRDREVHQQPVAQETRQAGPGISDQAFETYRIMVQSAENVSNRRGTANSFYLTLNTLLLGIVVEGPESLTVPLSIAGLATSATWFLLLKSYRDLNSAKFKIINRIEGHLEFPIFLEEWDALKKESSESPVGLKRWWERAVWRRYAEFNVVERYVPMVFGLLYATLLIVGIVDWVCN